MKTILRAALFATAALAATPAFAADAFTSFNGTQGAGGFTYGYASAANGATLTLFDATTPCAFNGSTACLLVANDGDRVPTAAKGGLFPTVEPTANALQLHPGNSAAESVFATYNATALGAYGYSINLRSIGTDTTNGVGYQLFTTSTGGIVTLLGTRALLPTYTLNGPTTTLTGTRLLGAGQSLGVFLDFNGDYGGDSTAVNFAINAVPEPATWAMMLLGFGMVGLGLRSRKRPAVTVTYA